MNKPGSHRGSNATKKKKFTRKEIKKKPIDLVDKLRDYIVEFAESGKNSHCSTMLRCGDLSKRFKCGVGDIVVALKQLQKENLVSQINKRFLSFYVFTEDEPKVKEILPKKIFNFKNCPLCGNELIANEYIPYWEGYSFKCKYSCYSYEYIINIHKINIFNREFCLKNDAHKSFKGQFIKDVKKQINKLKKNDRYLVEILIR